MDIKSEYKFELEKDEKYGDHVVVHVAGQVYDGGEKRRGGYAVWFGNGHALNLVEGISEDPYDIKAAILAVIQAHRFGIRRLKIKTNSKFLVLTMTDWINKWKENGWQTVADSPVKYRDAIEVLDKSCKFLENVVWEYIRSSENEALPLAQDAALP